VQALLAASAVREADRAARIAGRILVIYERLPYRLGAIDDPMKWPTYERGFERGFGFVVGAALGAAMGAIVIWVLQSPETRLRPIIKAFTPPPPVEQPATVEAFVARLRTSPLFSAMNAKPSSCSRVPKGAARHRCFYRAGDMEIVVGWYKNSGRLSALSIRTTEPRGSAPFAWPSIAEAVPILCGGLDTDQANALVRDVHAKLSQAPWSLRNGEHATADAEGASRRVVIKPRDGCMFVFSEAATGRTVQRLLRASPISEG